MINRKKEKHMKITSRTQVGNRAYWKACKLSKDGTLTKKTKLLIYKFAIKPVVTYTAEINIF